MTDLYVRSFIHSLAGHHTTPAFGAGQLDIPCTECKLDDRTHAIDTGVSSKEGHVKYLAVWSIKGNGLQFHSHLPLLVLMAG